jgi:hemerythrin
MVLIRLENDQRVNVSEIDSQHETLVELINQLHRAMTEREPKRVLEDIISTLVEHTRQHFLFEERLMRDHHYPDYAHHKAQHDRLIEHIVQLAERFRGGDLLLSFGVMMDLKGWAMFHIEKADKPLGVFLNSGNQDAPVDNAAPENETL